MTRRAKTSRPQKRSWTPLERATKVPVPEERIRALRAEAQALGGDPDKVEAHVRAEDSEMYVNNRYVVSVTRSEQGWVAALSIRRQDRQPEPFPWRDLQRIKTQLAGADAEAVELFPAEDRLVDTANQRWLWCIPRKERFPVGFQTQRVIGTPEQARAVGARQTALAQED